MSGDQLPMDFMLPTADWVVPSELPDLRGSGFVAIDTETRDDGLAHSRGPGWVYGAGRIVGVSMASKRGSVYVPVAHPETDNFPKENVGRWLSDHMHGADVPIFQNAAYDLGWIDQDWGIAVPEMFHDTLAMAYALDEQRLAYNLDSLCRWQGIEGKDETLLVEAARAYGYDPKGELWKLPARFVAPYAEQDAVSTLELFERMWPQIQAQNITESYGLERDLIPMVLAMRKRGVRFDTARAPEVRDSLLNKRDEALSELSRRIGMGRDVTMKDVKSPRFLQKWFEDENIKYPYTEKGAPSFQADWMTKIDHWLPKLVARTHKMHDAGDKFVQGYLMDYAHRGRLHAEIHQFKNDRGGTKTSRFAYSDPPLQQMPSRDPEIADSIRGLFMPERGEVWGALDYSQQEYRLIVHFAAACGVQGADAPVAKYNEDPRTDFHSLVAELTGLPRRRAKDVNFAKAFGAGVPKFALMTGMTLEEAKATMEQYDEEAPFVKRLSEFVQSVAGRRGYIRLIDGARVRFERWEPRWVDYKEAAQSGKPLGPCDRDEALRRINDPDHPWNGKLRRAFTHKALNWLIQGSAARQTKLSMRMMWQSGILPLLQMHDEIDGSFSSPEDAKRAEECMRESVKLSVPVVVDAEYGLNWGDSMKRKASYEDAMRALQTSS